MPYLLRPFYLNKPMKEKIKIQKGFIQIPLLVAIIISIVVVATVIGYRASKPSTKPSAATTTITTITIESSTTTIEKGGQLPTDDTFLVTRVIDGDTIEIEGGKKVRYIGIDTPETVDPRKPIQCFGVEASNKNKELVEGKRVRLEKDVSETDKYERLLRYVYVGELFVNDYLARQGYAYAYTYPPDVKYSEQFVQAQKEARENNRGLWKTCPVSTTTPTTTSISLPAQSPNTNCTIKGNISSSGEKIYHLEGRASYNVTKIDGARGERWFCTEEEAIAAGWRKAKNCP